ncbi:MAG: hypothetical protein ABIJ56_06870 [Pseudomonadota bacterium]
MQREKLIQSLTACLMMSALALLVFACKAPPIPGYEKESGHAAAHESEAQPATPATPATPEVSGPAGKAQVTEKSVEVGDVNRGETASHTFIVKNVAKEGMLTIKRASCG